MTQAALREADLTRVPNSSNVEEELLRFEIVKMNVKGCWVPKDNQENDAHHQYAKRFAKLLKKKHGVSGTPFTQYSSKFQEKFAHHNLPTESGAVYPARDVDLTKNVTPVLGGRRRNVQLAGVWSRGVFHANTYAIEMSYALSATWVKYSKLGLSLDAWLLNGRSEYCDAAKDLVEMQKKGNVADDISRHVRPQFGHQGGAGFDFYKKFGLYKRVGYVFQFDPVRGALLQIMATYIQNGGRESNLDLYFIGTFFKELHVAMANGSRVESDLDPHFVAGCIKAGSNTLSYFDPNLGEYEIQIKPVTRRFAFNKKSNFVQFMNHYLTYGQKVAPSGEFTTKAGSQGYKNPGLDSFGPYKSANQRYVRGHLVCYTDTDKIGEMGAVSGSRRTPGKASRSAKTWRSKGDDYIIGNKNFNKPKSKLQGAKSVRAVHTAQLAASKQAELARHVFTNNDQLTRNDFDENFFGILPSQTRLDESPKNMSPQVSARPANYMAREKEMGEEQAWQRVFDRNQEPLYKEAAEKIAIGMNSRTQEEWNNKNDATRKRYYEVAKENDMQRYHYKIKMGLRRALTPVEEEWYEMIRRDPRPEIKKVEGQAAVESRFYGRNHGEGAGRSYGINDNYKNCMCQGCIRGRKQLKIRLEGVPPPPLPPRPKPPALPPRPGKTLGARSRNLLAAANHFDQFARGNTNSSCRNAEASLDTVEANELMRAIEELEF